MNNLMDTFDPQEIELREDRLLAGDEATHPHVLRAFAQHPDLMLRALALANPSTPIEVVEEAIFEGTVQDAMAAGNNPALSDELRALAQVRYARFLVPGAHKNRLLKLRAAIQADH